MTMLLAPAAGLGGWHCADDPVNMNRPNFAILADFRYQRPNKFGATFVSGWWPGCGSIYTDSGGAYGDMLAAEWWEEPEVRSGQSGRLGVVGVTRDVYGSPLGGVTVKLFRTADDTLQGQVVSDVNNGTYLVTTPFNDGHYIVARKDGSPDVFGATDNDLVGA